MTAINGEPHEVISEYCRDVEPPVEVEDVLIEVVGAAMAMCDQYEISFITLIQKATQFYYSKLNDEFDEMLRKE